MSENNTKIVYGQAWIQEDNIYQQQTLYTEVNGKTITSDNTECLVKDIWKNLLESAQEDNKALDHNKNHGYFKANGNKKYFYWTYIQTAVDGTDTVTVRLECPKPKEGLLESYFKKDNGFQISPMDWDLDEKTSPLKDSEWALYWAGEMKAADTNYNKKTTLQPKETPRSPEVLVMDYQHEEYKNVHKDITPEVRTENGNIQGSQEGDNLITDLLNLF